jgi:L-ascorbate metabolism protein UlaG (beta-lactamase superfamily)
MPMARSVYPVSDHCDGTRFSNPHAVAGRGLGDVLKWQRSRQQVAWPDHVPLVPHDPPPGSVSHGQVAATFIGHATFVLRTADAVFLTDPVFTSHAGPFGRFGPRRVREPAIPLDRIPKPAVVLVSHNHYDHLQPSSLRGLRDRSDPLFVAPLGVGAFLRSRGLIKVVELDWWESHDAGGSLITAVPAQHFSARTPFDRNLTLWCGFVVRSAGATIYFTGDSGYSPQFAEIGRRHPGIDLALIPVGAYEPRWFMQPMHVNPREAVQIHRDVAPRVSIGMHYGTFRLTDEGIDDPRRALEAARAELHVSEAAFRLLDFGESVVV